MYLVRIDVVRPHRIQWFDDSVNDSGPDADNSGSDADDSEPDADDSELDADDSRSDDIGSDEIEITESTRGRKKLGYRGYLYTRKANHPNSIRWECAIRRTLDFKGTGTTSLQVSHL